MSDFFDTVDSMGIVEDHIQRVLKLEDSSATKLLRRYKEVRHTLNDRLQRAREGSFTAQQLGGVLAQVDGAIIAMSESLKTGMGDQAFSAAMLGISDQVSELKAFEKEFNGAVVAINLDAQLIAQDTQNFLINRYESSIDAYSQGLRSSLVQSLTNEALMESSYSTVVQKLGGFFQGEEWKLHRIARTELHNIYGMGKLNGMLETQRTVLPDLMKTLIHPMDSRTGADSKYAARLNMIVPLDEPFKYKWKGKIREFMSPPDRPNDRSIIVPYRQTWGK